MRLNVKFLLLTGLLLSSAFSLLAQKPVSVQSLLQEMVDADEIAKWPQPLYTEHMASSYDRHSVSPNKPGWFANADASQFIRTEEKNGHKEYVIMDADGPGAIVRFWLTTFKRDGVLRIYFDNNPDPEITIPAYDLLKSNLQLGKALLTPHSSYEPKEKGGSTLYLPMPFSKHCKVTWEDAEAEVKQPRYYQVNYRKYVTGTKVKTFTISQLNDLTNVTDAVNKALLNPADDTAGKKSSLKTQVAPGSKANINLPEGPAAIRYLSIRIHAGDTAAYAQALRSNILEIKFDGKQTVWCPLGDFSGSGIGGKPLQSWYRTVGSDGNMVCRWVMPYANSASITIENAGTEKVDIDLKVVTEKWKWDNRSMYFNATWKSTRHIPVRKTEDDKPIEWTFNAIKGKGLFLGDTFSVYNYMHAWYGEGDQKLWVDDDKFPSEFGTGTEDYYNTSWAPVVLYQTPFANAPRADNADSFGYNVFTRTRILDAVPFNKNFKYTLEMLGWQNGEIDAAAVTYWYGFKNTNSRITGNKKEAATLLP